MTGRIPDYCAEKAGGIVMHRGHLRPAVALFMARRADRPALRPPYGQDDATIHYIDCWRAAERDGRNVLSLGERTPHERFADGWNPLPAPLDVDGTVKLIESWLDQFKHTADDLGKRPDNDGTVEGGGIYVFHGLWDHGGGLFSIAPVWAIYGK